MNNKILFRGFHLDENGETVIMLNGGKVRGEWICGDLISLGEERYICYANEHHSIRDIGALSLKVISETVGQFVTTDKNGKDLFEGDIVQGTIVSQWSKSLIRCEIVRKEYEFVCIEHTVNRDWSHKVKFAKDIELISNKWECAE